MCRWNDLAVVVVDILLVDAVDVPAIYRPDLETKSTVVQECMVVGAKHDDVPGVVGTEMWRTQWSDVMSLRIGFPVRKNQRGVA